MPRAVEVTAPVSRLVTLTLTRDELTSLLHALESERDRARAAYLETLSARNHGYRQALPDMQRKQREAAHKILRDIDALCDRVSDVWADNRN